MRTFGDPDEIGGLIQVMPPDAGVARRLRRRRPPARCA
jgi:hypothetical protein